MGVKKYSSKLNIFFNQITNSALPQWNSIDPRPLSNNSLLLVEPLTFCLVHRWVQQLNASSKGVENLKFCWKRSLWQGHRRQVNKWEQWTGNDWSQKLYDRKCHCWALRRVWRWARLLPSRWQHPKTWMECWMTPKYFFELRQLHH